MKRRAFTLLELLVVITIIALLMAIMLPALNETRQMARRTVCASNLKTIWTATNMYAAEWDDNVSLRHPGADIIDLTIRENNNWNARYYKYIGKPEVLVCPSFNRDKEGNDKILYRFTVEDVEIFVTYTMNEFIANSANPSDKTKEMRHKLSTITKFAVNDQWMGIFIGDGINEVDNWGDRSSQTKPQERGQQPGRASYRHGGKCMFLTTDGRVGFYDEKASLLLPRQGIREITPSMLR